MAASEIDQLDTLRHSIIGLVRREGPDLTARQLAIFLICYLESEAQTVRGLAAKLSVQKPVVSRALDRLAEFNLVRRDDDPLDRRSILVRRTPVGLHLLRQLGRIMEGASVRSGRAGSMRMASPRARSKTAAGLR